LPPHAGWIATARRNGKTQTPDASEWKSPETIDVRTKIQTCWRCGRSFSPFAIASPVNTLAEAEAVFASFEAIHDSAGSKNDTVSFAAR